MKPLLLNSLFIPQVSGILVWAMIGYRQISVLVAEPSLLTHPDMHVWSAAYLTFGLSFWLNTWRLRGSLLLWVQVAAALSIIATGRVGFEGGLLSLIAGQMPLFLPSRRAVLGVGALALVSLSLYLVVFPPRVAWTTSISYLSLMVFTFSSAVTWRREAESLRELARVHLELKAAQALLAKHEREQERLRIARDLHDSLGHHLTALSLNLEAASHTTQGSGIEHVHRAQKLSRSLLGEVRQAVSSMREVPTQLGPALQALAGEVSGLAIHLRVPDDLSIEPAEAHCIFRCVQEVITNTLRHANACNLWIDVTFLEEGGIQVYARDDGRGALALQPGSGLSGMQERFAQLGGKVEPRLVEGQGMELVAWLPPRRDRE